MMESSHDLARVARTLGDPSRLRMLNLLMSGRALTAKELAYGTGVKPATATAHLRRLLDDQLVVVHADGRHKYFRLASSEVGRCIESILVVAQPAARELSAPLSSIRLARVCYDHLAGRLGIEIAQGLVKKQILRSQARSYRVTPKGTRWFANCGVDISAAKGARRQFACGCLDWSERVDHLGGALGAALASRMFDAGWLRRTPDSRVVTVTKPGIAALADKFGIRWNPAG